MCDRNKLAVIARAEAEKPYNGKLNNCAPNIQVSSHYSQSGLWTRLMGFGVLHLYIIASY